MRIVTISGSLRKVSSNTRVLQAAAALAPEGMELVSFEGIGDLPHFNPDLDGEAPPAPVAVWRKTLQAADGVMICTPEYANGVPGVLKNALDWLVSSGELVNKPTAVISASPLATGGKVAHASLMLTLGMITAHLFEGGQLSIPLVSKKINELGEWTDAETAEEIRRLLERMSDAVLKRRSE
ncbi:NADPH-dependent FMN reductase [Paenibacillus sp. OAS669]|uniref:NADPH-dependent FMN reductase n=1 Tax=Paenibacillus sp. OAS669 TaxID=2663821 RepID=UPI00178BD6AA|nr:NADPH-dependent FMN reductase [Paenibacillus sp. OAS669]MBE1443562.1 NAD(P)H-dependent FMN reductase [Paenibacillus sp. OAS669]